jgi:hypothetical protein
MKTLILISLILSIGSVMAAPVKVNRDPQRVEASSDAVTVVIEKATGRASIRWREPADARVTNIGCSLEIDGHARDPKDIAIDVKESGDYVDLVQRWGDEATIQRTWRIDSNQPFVVQSLKITNASKKTITLGTMKLAGANGAESWKLSAGDRAPAAIYIQGASTLTCRPAAAAADASYGGTQILALVDASHQAALVAGYLSAQQGVPEIAAGFSAKDSGNSLLMQQRLMGRQLPAGQSVELDPIYFSASTDPYRALEQYGDTVARFSPIPPRHGANSLWCSWYAHRMAVNEELILANAKVAAKFFQPLGTTVMQLDHGWQKGEVTGDWIAKQAFPHGFDWLSKELESKYGMKLGLWIAPTDVADTSDTYKQHSDWMLKGDDGKPLVNWKWYWKPNPNCYELDATNPAAAKWMSDSFAALTAQGASYYKIDFIAASAGEHFHQSDPTVTRGWGNLVRAMQAVRKGAGEKAWIRYCQAPPLLAVGLADSAYGGDDTYDAGTENTMQSLRGNARSLAAGYWINDRLYHREVCDMSVRMQADVEEVRLRLAVMSLAGCSIAYSDELQHLPPSRIRMMQQCLPPGAPAMKPIDLFDRDIPSIWQIHCAKDGQEWDIVGLFNFADEPQERTIDFAALHLPADANIAVFEFWREQFEGVHRGSFSMTLPPHTSRIVSLRRVTGSPQVVSTDMQVLQGWHDLTGVKWDEKAKTLSGTAIRMPGMSGKVFIHVPETYQPHFDFPLVETSAHLTHIAGPIWSKEIQFEKKQEKWEIPFDAKK